MYQQTVATQHVHQKTCLFFIFSLILSISITVKAASSDNVFDHMEQLSADTLVTLVLQRNPDLKASHSAWQASLARIDYMGALDDPLVKYSVAPRTLYDSDIDPRHSVALSQRLPWSGKRQLQRDYARYQANASENSIQISQLVVIEMARSAFAKWYYVHAALKINERNQSLVKEFKNIAEIKYSTGKVSKQDVLQSEMEILLLQQEAIRLNRERFDIRASLNQLLNRAADDFIPLPENISYVPHSLDSASLLKEAQSNHPELLMLAQQIAAEKASVALADKTGYPDFTVSAAYNGIMDPDEKRLQLGVAVNIPFGSKVSAKKRESRARLKQKQWQQQSLRNTLQSQLEQYLAQLQESQQLLQLYKDSLLPLAQESFTTAKQDYETGRGDFLSLIATEKNLEKTLLMQERILTDYYQRLAQLDRVIGRVPTSINPALTHNSSMSSITAMGDKS